MGRRCWENMWGRERNKKIRNKFRSATIYHMSAKNRLRKNISNCLRLRFRSHFLTILRRNKIAILILFILLKKIVASITTISLADSKQSSKCIILNRLVKPLSNNKTQSFSCNIWRTIKIKRLMRSTNFCSSLSTSSMQVQNHFNAIITDTAHFLSVLQNKTTFFACLVLVIT